MDRITSDRGHGYWRSRRFLKLALWSIFIGVFLGGCSTPLRVEEKAEEPPQRVFPLKEITTERAQTVLFALGLSEVFSASEPNGLLVQGSPLELQRAGVVLALVDVNEPYVIQRLVPATEARTLPSNDQIAEAIGNIAIGTFSRPPQRGDRSGAIIDIYADSVWAIVPARLWPDVRAVVESGGKAVRQRRENQPSAESMSSQDATESQQKSQGVTSEQGTSASVGESSAVPQTLPLAANGSAGDVVTAGQSEPTQSATRDRSSSGESVVHGPASSDRPAHDSESADQIVTGTLTPLGENSVHAGNSGRMQVPLDNGDEVLELTLPEKVNLIQFIDLVGGYLRLDCVYDAEKIADQVVTVKLHSKLQSEIRVKDLYALLETILKFKGLVMTRHEGNLVTIVPAGEALDIDPDLVDPNTASLQAGEMVVTRVFRLQYIDVASVSNLLQNMKLGLAVSSVPENQTLFVTCYAHRMGRIVDLVDMVDRPGRPKEFRFRQLRYTVAKALAEKVTGLAAELEDIPITIAVEQKETAETPAAGRQPRRAKGPSDSTAASGSTERAVYLDMDERTNRILMIGYGEQLVTVERLIEALDIPEQDVRTLRVYEIKHVEAASVMTKLTELGIVKKATRPTGKAAKGEQAEAAAEEKTPDEELQVVLLEATNALLVNATSEQHERMLEIIQHIDNSPQDLRKVKVYPVEHMEAQDVLDKLEKLGVIESASGSSPRLTEASTPAPSRGGTATGKGDALTANPQAVVLEASNSLFVRAMDSQHIAIEAMIHYMDVEAKEERIPYEIYFLENQDPEQLSQVLGKLIQETIVNKEGKIEQVVQKTEDQVIIVPDKTTFSLIVYASPKNQEWVADLVGKLDRRMPQVLIDVTLVEISESEAFSYDLNLITGAPDLTQSSGLTGTLAGGTDPITSTDIADKLATGGRSQFAEFQSNGGEMTAFYGDKHINMLLQAMQSKDYGRVLAKPKILVNDNEQGSIVTKETTYVQTTGSSLTSESSSLVETSTKYDPYDAGVTLTITPHISQGNLLRMEIELTRSDFRSTSDTEKPPDTTSSELKTTVFVPDASTIILGGLLLLDQSKGGTKVPILGDIPIVGGLFRTINNQDSQSKLYIFVKAEIIRPEGAFAQEMRQLEVLSERNRRAFEKHEREFQEYQSWPGVKSQPVDPSRVLEAR